MGGLLGGSEVRRGGDGGWRETSEADDRWVSEMVRSGGGASVQINRVQGARM